MIDRKNKAYYLIKIMGIPFGIQVIRVIVKQIILQFIEKNSMNSDLVTLLEMTLFIFLILMICKKRNISLSIFPNAQGKNTNTGYSIVTVIVLFLIISKPIFSNDISSSAIIPLILSAIATPVFEELIFRGYVWNELKHCYKNELIIYVITTLLFAIWHLGYADSIWFKMTLTGSTNELPFVIFMKVVTGLCFGIILGFVRYKFKNCYSSILIHSFMNIFGR